MKQSKKDAARKAREWREKNKERCSELARKYQQENKEVIAARKQKYRQDNKEALAEWDRNHFQENRESILARRRRHYQHNKDAYAERMRRYREENADKVKASKVKRLAAKRDRIPSWFGELDQFVLEEAYGLTAERQELTGIEWHVDHMVPMQSRKASGLHCAANIQVIPAVMNLEKNNKMRLTKPLEWLA